MSRSPGTVALLAALYREASPARRHSLHLTLVLMVFAALAEMLTIGILLPLLTLVSDSVPAMHSSTVRLFTGLIDSGNPDLLLPRAILLLAVAAISAAIIRLGMLRTSQRLAFTLGHDISARIFSRMLHQPYRNYLGRKPSEVFAGIDNIQVLINGVLGPLMQAATSTILGFGIMAMLLVIAPEPTLVAMLVIAVIYGGIAVANRERLRTNSMAMAAMAKARIQALHEGHGGLRDIILDRAQRVFEDKFNRIDNAFRKAQADNQFFAGAPRFVVEAAGIVLVGLLAGRLDAQPGGLAASLPVLGALALGAQRLLPLLNHAYFGWSQFAGNRQVLHDMLILLQMPVVSPRGEVAARPLAHEIRFEDVSLVHPGRGAVLRGINLVIARGERVGIVGPTGSGKSSLLDLLMGLVEPSQGQILIDGVRLDDDSRSGWQAALAHVPQTIYLADASIAANIAFGQTEASVDRSRVQDAARLAMLDPFIAILEQGLETEVGDRGIALSGGQRQRIGLARAFFKQATLLVLDEATGQLDPDTESAVLDAIAALPRDHTVVIVAHSPSGLAEVDRIVRLEDGRIVEDGPA